eukprot:CAMPEP_0172668650 /NCGR_PEP_ID=MMETSP1074-20121228/9179_1 /TAXON_ID=2916 /ORGANISM="Ceratium fusus, Strain PA161109" /LENGTH=58 /DNA_ID=CAMNT_0013485317 /DNA_START=609 /DNA_END=785 /DNA_ORIENTATION=-
MVVWSIGVGPPRLALWDDIPATPTMAVTAPTNLHAGLISERCGKLLCPVTIHHSSAKV